MEVDQDNILDTSKLRFFGNFDLQVSEIMQLVRLSRHEVQSLQHLLDDLEGVLRGVWPGCRVLAFGSIVTGLGIRSSDIDCYVALPHNYKIGPLHPVVLAKTALRKYGNIFAQPFSIISAKIPIVKFMHIPTGFNCDVNFTSMSGVRNSRMVQYLLSLDPRALPFSILLKYWSKVHRLTGTNLMPNYALTLMAIFYLQTRSILPSVEEVQKHIQPHIEDHWNSAISYGKPFSNNNGDSMYKLLRGFFKFYAEYDFNELMISPYLGFSLLRKDFESVETTPSQFHLYKMNVRNKVCKPIRLNCKVCVQDPIDHSWNCSVAVSGKLFARVLENFDFASRMFEDKNEYEVLRVILTEGPGFTEVLQNGVLKHVFKNKIHKKKAKKPRPHAKDTAKRWQLDNFNFHKGKT